MQTKPNAYFDALRPRLSSVCPLNGDRARYRFAGPGKRVEERITLRVHFLAVVGGERFAHEPAVRRQGFGIAGVAELLEQAGAALDVTEDERDRASWQLCHGSAEHSRVKEGGDGGAPPPP
jgi:hypothetical protein